MATTTEEIAKELFTLCSQGQFDAVIEKYYSDDIVSIEAMGNEQMPARQEGIEAIKGKNQWWVENHDIHSVKVGGPLAGGDKFAVTFELDVTFKPTGQRNVMKELALYTVKDGKIAQEEFFYPTPGAGA
ncbi:MAG: nuclear transport factor 2 family protein [Acidobacteria bacterium]|nr:nuclear transport factor 2 family protein [Acidobacteriota bacterium]